MKKIALLAALALALPAWAQEQKPAPAQEPAKAEAAPSKPVVKPVARKPNPKRQEDARHCLEKASSEEVIKCAEAYL